MPLDPSHQLCVPIQSVPFGDVRHSKSGTWALEQPHLCLKAQTCKWLQKYKNSVRCIPGRTSNSWGVMLLRAPYSIKMNLGFTWTDLTFHFPSPSFPQSLPGFFPYFLSKPLALESLTQVLLLGKLDQEYLLFSLSVFLYSLSFFFLLYVKFGYVLELKII